MPDSGPPAAGWRPATRDWASLIEDPDESLQAIDVEDSVPEDDNVTSADDGSFLYLSLRGAWICRRVVVVMWSPFAEAISVDGIDVVEGTNIR